MKTCQALRTWWKLKDKGRTENTRIGAKVYRMIMHPIEYSMAIRVQLLIVCRAKLSSTGGKCRTLLGWSIGKHQPTNLDNKIAQDNK